MVRLDSGIIVMGCSILFLGFVESGREVWEPGYVQPCLFPMLGDFPVLVYNNF